MPATSARRARRVVDVAFATFGVASLLAGAVTIGIARSRWERFLYISELGAEHMRTASQFQLGFVLVCVGIACVAVVVRDLRSHMRGLSGWRPAVSLAAAAALFLVASQVPCSHGCPAIFTDDALARDYVHVTSAVLGFVAGCVAMLQLSGSGDAWMRRLSIVGGLAIGVIAGIGGLISLMEGNTDIGSTLEFVAAGLGVAWLMTVAVVHASGRHALAVGSGAAQQALVSDMASGTTPAGLDTTP